MSLVRRRRTFGPRRSWRVPAFNPRNSWEQPAIGSDLSWPDPEAPTVRLHSASRGPDHTGLTPGDAGLPVVPTFPATRDAPTTDPHPPAATAATGTPVPTDPSVPVVPASGADTVGAAGPAAEGRPGPAGADRSDPVDPDLDPHATAGPAAAPSPGDRAGAGPHAAGQRPVGAASPAGGVPPPTAPGATGSRGPVAGRGAPSDRTSSVRTIPVVRASTRARPTAPAATDPWQPAPARPATRATWCAPAAAPAARGAEARAATVGPMRSRELGPGGDPQLADALRSWRALALAPAEAPPDERAPTRLTTGRARRRDVSDDAAQRREALAAVTRGSESGDRHGFLAEVRRRLGVGAGRDELLGLAFHPGDDDRDQGRPAVTGRPDPDGAAPGTAGDDGWGGTEGTDDGDGTQHAARIAGLAGLAGLAGTARPSLATGSPRADRRTGAVPALPSPRADRDADPGPAELVPRFVQAVEAAGGVCHRVTGDLPDSLLDVLVAELDAWEVVVSGDEEVHGVAERLASRGVDVAWATPERALAAGMGVTSAAAGIATTGALVLDSHRDRGRLAALVPPVHLCVVPVERLVPTPSAVLRPLGHTPVRLPSSLMLLTGPPRGDDVERLLTVGAVGPTALHVVLLERDRA